MKRTSLRRAAVVALTAVAALSLPALPNANAAGLTSVQWSVSNNAKGAASTNYTYQFTTATTGTIKTVEMTVPAGTAGTPALASNYGLSAGTVGLAANTITYTVTSAASVGAGVPILLEFSGLTNPGSVGSYTSDVTTKTSAPAVIDGPTTSNSVSIADNNTAVTAVVAKSLSFTNDTSAFTWLLDPGLAALKTQSRDVVLTVKTNASVGYTLSANDGANGLVATAHPADNIARFTADGQSASAAIWGTNVNKFGFSPAITGGAGANIDPEMGSAKFAGYKNTAETILSRTTPTGETADALTVSNKASIDFNQASGTYTDMIVNSVVPSY